MDQSPSFDASKIERPDAALFRYYIYCALLSGPLTPIVLAPLWCRYVSLRYKFDDSGVSMSWGIFFRREIYLTYRRLQDIHLTRNLLQRWMGLAKISLQTASGSSQAEMAIEGVLEAEQLRDYLYSQMRGAKNETTTAETQAVAGASLTPVDAGAALASDTAERTTRALEGIRDSLQGLVSRQQAGGER